MNSRQTNKLDSYAAVEAVLKSKPEVASIPGLPARLTTLSAKMDEIKSLVQTQIQPVKAATATRDQLLDEMTGMVLEIAGYITSIAREEDRSDLLHVVDVGPGLRRTRRAVRLVVAQSVHDAAQGVLPQLAAYGVTEETLTSLQARIKSASDGLALPRSTVATKKGATTKLARLFGEVDVLLADHIDRLVFPMRKTDVEFHAAYLAARSIVDRPGSRSTGTVPPPGETVPTSNAAPAASESDKAAA